MAQAYTKTTWTQNTLPAMTAGVMNGWESGIYLASAPLVTSLPASPVDGQECNYVADSANGVVWHLVYRASDSKWVYTGGPELVGESSLNEGAVTSTAYVNLNATLVLPLNGDYMIEAYAQEQAGDTLQATGYISPKIGAAAAADIDAIVHRNDGSGNNAFLSQSMKRRKTGITAGTTIRLQARVTAGNYYPTANGANPIGIRATPVRVS